MAQRFNRQKVVIAIILILSIVSVWLLPRITEEPLQVSQIQVLDHSGIVYIVGHIEIPRELVVRLGVEASGSNLQYEWKAERGRILNPKAPFVNYIPPDDTSFDTVVVVVTNGDIKMLRSIFLSIVPMSTPTPALTPLPIEITESTELLNDDVLGELNVEYPIRMSPSSSDSVVVSIHIPTSLASFMPVEIERIEIPLDAPLVVGELNSHTATILVAQQTRAELSSPTFNIENLYPLKQKIDFSRIGKPTVWAWNVVAPDTQGTHVLTLRVFSGDNDTPNWVGNIKVEVAELKQPLPLPFIIIVAFVIVGIGYDPQNL